jgi:hypothetical protein
MKRIMFSLLTVTVLLTGSVSNTRSAPRTTCGPAVNGHTVGGDLPTEWCSQDDLPVFPESAHVYSKSTTTCPIDHTPLIGGHSLNGG